MGTEGQLRADLGRAWRGGGDGTGECSSGLLEVGSGVGKLWNFGFG